MNLTPELTPAEYRRMTGAGGSEGVWEARISSVNPLTVWLCIPGEMPSLNVTLREHHMVAHRRLQEWTANMQALVVVHKLPRFEKAQMCVVYYFRTNRKRDEGNYNNFKQLLDAMVKANIIADDNAEVLKLAPPEFRVDKQRPRTEVFVSEWKGAE